MMGHGSLPVLTRYLKQIKEDLGEVHARSYINAKVKQACT
jgi:hypothetical protein